MRLLSLSFQPNVEHYVMRPHVITYLRIRMPTQKLPTQPVCASVVFLLDIPNDRHDFLRKIMYPVRQQTGRGTQVNDVFTASTKRQCRRIAQDS